MKEIESLVRLKGNFFFYKMHVLGNYSYKKLLS